MLRIALVKTKLFFQEYVKNLKKKYSLEQYPH